MHITSALTKFQHNPFANKFDYLQEIYLARNALDLDVTKELALNVLQIESVNNSSDSQPKLDLVEISLDASKLKNDLASMEAPIFSLSKVKDTKIWTWESVDCRKKVTVIPSVLGRATIFDKDIIIYVISSLMKRKNIGLPLSKTVRFKLYDYLKFKGYAAASRSDYLRFEKALKRLKGTSIETNIKTDNIEIVGLFSLVEKALMIKVDGKLECVEITLSDWIFNSVDCKDVATINADYLKLHKSLEKRLYEIARKHCNNKADWKIGIENLLKKTGSRASLKEFNRMIREIIESDQLPDYRIKVDGKSVVFYQKDTKKLADALAQK